MRQQLQYVQRNLKYINQLIEAQRQLRDVLDKRDWKLLQVIHELHRQQQEMHAENKHSIADRIVSIYQLHVRPMPRGKDRVRTEFGSK
jgi:transposase, IS5 family